MALLLFLLAILIEVLVIPYLFDQMSLKLCLCHYLVSAFEYIFYQLCD